MYIQYLLLYLFILLLYLPAKGQFLPDFEESSSIIVVQQLIKETGIPAHVLLQQEELKISKEMSSSLLVQYDSMMTHFFEVDHRRFELISQLYSLIYLIDKNEQFIREQKLNKKVLRKIEFMQSRYISKVDSLLDYVSTHKIELGYYVYIVNWYKAHKDISEDIAIKNWLHLQGFNEPTFSLAFESEISNKLPSNQQLTAMRKECYKSLKETHPIQGIYKKHQELLLSSDRINLLIHAINACDSAGITYIIHDIYHSTGKDFRNGFFKRRFNDCLTIPIEFLGKEAERRKPYAFLLANQRLSTTHDQASHLFSGVNMIISKKRKKHYFKYTESTYFDLMDIHTWPIPLIDFETYSELHYLTIHFVQSNFSEVFSEQLVSKYMQFLERMYEKGLLDPEDLYFYKDMFATAIYKQNSDHGFHFKNIMLNPTFIENIKTTQNREKENLLPLKMYRFLYTFE